MGVDNIIWNNFGKLVILLILITILLQSYYTLYLMKIEQEPKPSHTLYRRIKAPEISTDYLQSLVKKIQNAHKMDSSGQYIVVPNFAKARMKTADGNVTKLSICTQSTVKNLYNLVELLQVWDGPVSVTVFAHGKDVVFAAYAIAYYNSCLKNVTYQVSFHIVYPISHPPENIESLLKVDHRCEKHKFVKRSNSLNYANALVPYPHNVLRNVAIYYSETPYIMVTDIDLIPSADLHSGFQKFIHRKAKVIEQKKVVFVVPAFESKSDLVEYNKSFLLIDWASEQVRTFYETVCVRCQKPTDYERWRQLPNMGFLDIGYTLNWTDPWEPFYIAQKNDLPQYDSRFKQYGFNRISQVCELHLAGYQFAVLNNAFVVHKGFKEPDGFHMSKTEENNRNRDLFRKFKEELKERYKGSGREC